MGLKEKLIRRLIGNKRNREYERLLTLQAQSILNQNRRHDSISDLSDVEVSAFSQWGEDGIIDWLISRIPHIPHTFIEFGVESYREANTRLLLKLRNWRGLVIDGCADHIQRIQSQDIYWRHFLTAECAYIDRNNINAIIQSAGFDGEVGLLSIDIDGNDYWVWEAIDVVNPAIVVVEYNAVFGDVQSIAIPYNPEFQRLNAHYSGLYFGASIVALIELGKNKGYTFVGTTSNGVNAFFVKNEFVDGVLPHISERSAFPSLFREARDEDGTMLYLNGIDRLKYISAMTVFDLIQKEEIALGKYEIIYSPEWAAGGKVTF